MSAALELLVLTALLGTIATLIGRALAAVLEVPLLRRATPEAFLVSAFLGTGLLMLAYGWGSYAGLAGSGCLVVVGLVLAALLAYMAARRRLGLVLRLPRPRLCALFIALALAARVVVYLLPIFRGSCYIPHNDAGCYITLGEWLQGNGFGVVPPEDPHQPANLEAARLQFLNHRMGPMFLLALVRAAVPFRVAAELYPAVMAWGLALNVAGVFVLARWGLRVPRWHAAAGTAALAVALDSLSYSGTHSFFCQVYGTAALAFGLAVLARLRTPANWRPGNAALLGLIIAALFSMYSELSPVLGVAALAVAGCGLWRRWRRPARLLRFAAVVLLSLAVFANVECLRAVRGVVTMAGLSSPVGYPLRWEMSDYGKFVLGFYPLFFLPPGQPGPPIYLLGTILAGLSCLLGLARACRRRAVPMLAALLVLGSLAVLYRFAAHDPWSGARGHSWYLFKLGKWSFPLVATFEVAGLSLVLRRLRRGNTLAWLFCAVAVCASLPMQMTYSQLIARTVTAQVGHDARLRSMGRLVRRIDRLAPSRLYYISEPNGPWPRCFAPMLLCPRPFANGWKGSYLGGPDWLRDDVPEAFAPGTLYFQHGWPPFSPPLEYLPFGYSRVDGTKPLLFRCQSPNGLEGPPGEAGTWVGIEPVELFVFSSRPGCGVLSFESRRGPSLPGTARRHVCLTDGTGTAREITVEVKEGARIAIPVALTAGVNRLELRCPDRPTASHPGAPCILLLYLRAARIESFETTHPGPALAGRDRATPPP
jgi:hypothetical protein